jgi:hypothetical protein
MYLYRPFNILKDELQEFQLLGYAGITLIVNGSLLLFFKQVLKPRYSTENGTVGKYIFYNLILVFVLAQSISIYNTYFLLEFSLDINSLLRIQRNVLLTGIFPIVFVYGILRNLQLKRNLISHNIKPYQSEKKEGIFDWQGKTIEIKTETSESFKIVLHSLLFVEAQNNYSEVHYLEDGEMKFRLLRLNLKNLETQLPTQAVIRCHRSYLVNKDKIEKIGGNVKVGHKINLKGSTKTIPLSRSHFKEISQLLKSGLTKA